MNLEDARRVLDIPEVYDLALLKQQYRQKSKKHHPDLNPDNAFAHQAFLNLGDAGTKSPITVSNQERN